MAEPLKIRFAADIDDAKKGLANLAASVASNAISMATTLKAVNDNASKIGPTFNALASAARTAVAGFIAFEAAKAAIAGIEAVTKAAAEQVERLAEIGQKASDFGVSTSFLQGLTNQARALGVEAEAVEKVLEKLKAVSIVRQGSGGEDAVNESALGAELRKQVEAGNLTQSSANRVNGAADNEARLKALLDLMLELYSQGKMLAALEIGDKFFPADIIDRFRNSVVELEKFRAAAAAAANENVVGQDQIERAQELNRRMVEAKDTLANGLKPVYDDLARAGYSFHESNVQWVEFLAARIPQIVSLWNSVQRAAANAARQTQGLPVSQGSELVGVIPKYGSAATPDQPDAMAIARAKLASRMNPTAIEAAQRDSQSITNALFPDKTKPKITKSSKAPSEAEEQDPVQSYIESLQRSTAALKAEADTYGKSNEEKQKAIALARGEEIAKQRGTALTDDERRSLEAVGTAAGVAKDRLAEMQAQSARAAEAMRAFGDMATNALSDLIVDGKSFTDVLSSMEKQIAKMALQAVVTGSGPLAGLLGTSPAVGATGADTVGGLFGGLAKLFKGFGGGFADGGTVGTDKWALVGERGPELIGPAGTARMVIPDIGKVASATSGSASSTSSSSIAVHLGDTTIDARGSSMTEGQMKAILAAHQRDTLSKVPAAVVAARGRSVKV